MEFVCETCTEVHSMDLDASSFGTSEPAQWWLLSLAERAESALSAEQCIIHADGETSYFVAAVLEIPIKSRRQRSAFRSGYPSAGPASKTYTLGGTTRAVRKPAPTSAGYRRHFRATPTPCFSKHECTSDPLDSAHALSFKPTSTR